MRLSVGLLGRLLTILLLVTGIEFAVSTALYERSSRALIRGDDAHRLAEHLVIARALVAERPWAERPAMAARLSTDRYDVHWAGRSALPPPAHADRGEASRRVLEWEPSLAGASLRVRLIRAGREAQLFGALQLTDGTWLRFRAHEPGESGWPDWSRVLGALLPAAALLALGALVFRHTLRPIDTLAAAAERIGRGGGVAVAEGGPDEVRRLIRAFNAMQARIGTLIADRTQALAAVGHDLRTPLARLGLRSDAVAEPGLRRSIGSDLAEMEAMVGSLLSFLGGEADPEVAAPIDVAVMVATVIDDAVDRGEDATYAGAAHLEARVRATGLKRAVVNLVDNALHYGGVARATVERRAEQLVIRVEDDGPGIAPERLAEVRQPFVRLDRARARNTGGLGLGLAIVARAAEAEGGALVLANRPEGGLVAELVLPLR
jgi:signal transduction histidine kinase